MKTTKGTTCSTRGSSSARRPQFSGGSWLTKNLLPTRKSCSAVLLAAVLTVCLLSAATLSACSPNDPTEAGSSLGSGASGAERQSGAASAGSEPGTDALPPLPAPSEGAGVDATINQETIDQWLGREDVAYRDVRMLYDPADFASVGGKPALTQSLPGFKVVPYPYLGTLPASDIAGMYAGDTLFTVAWEGETLLSATANYEESLLALEDLFPRDRAIFLMCGGSKYAEFTKLLLVELGWDADLLYNIGANWGYEGKNAVIFTEPSASDPSSPLLMTWRMDVTVLDFALMHPLKAP